MPRLAPRAPTTILAIVVVVAGGAAVGRAQVGAPSETPASIEPATEAQPQTQAETQPETQPETQAETQGALSPTPAADEPRPEAQVPATGGAEELGDPGASEPLGAALFSEDEERAPPHDHVGSSPRSFLGAHLAGWVELGITAGGPDRAEVVAFSPEVGVRYRVADVVVADVSWGLVVADTHVFGEATLGGEPVAYDAEHVRVDPGNPVFTGGYAGRVARDVELEVGLGLAVPTAARAENGADAEGLALRAASEASHRAALSMRGFWSPWRFAPERFGLLLPLRVAARLDRFLVEGEGGLGVLVPVLGDGRADVDVTLQLAAGLGVHVLEPLHIGLRARVVGGASGTTVPGALASAEPYVRLALGQAQVSLRGVINLHGPDGLVGSRGPGFGIFAAVGVTD